MNADITQFIIETGNEFYDTLPDAATSNPDTDARDWIDSFVRTTMQSLELALHHHLDNVAQDWNAQAGRDLA